MCILYETLYAPVLYVSICSNKGKKKGLKMQTCNIIVMSLTYQQKLLLKTVQNNSLMFFTKAEVNCFAIQNKEKKCNFLAIFTVSRNFIATNTLKTSQLTSQFFRKAAANSGILGRNNLEKRPRNPVGDSSVEWAGRAGAGKPQHSE